MRQVRPLTEIRRQPRRFTGVLRVGLPRGAWRSEMATLTGALGIATVTSRRVQSSSAMRARKTRVSSRAASWRCSIAGIGPIQRIRQAPDAGPTQPALVDIRPPARWSDPPTTRHRSPRACPGGALLRRRPASKGRRCCRARGAQLVDGDASARDRVKGLSSSRTAASE